MEGDRGDHGPHGPHGPQLRTCTNLAGIKTVGLLSPKVTGWMHGIIRLVPSGYPDLVLASGIVVIASDNLTIGTSRKSGIALRRLHQIYLFIQRSMADKSR